MQNAREQYADVRHVRHIQKHVRRLDLGSHFLTDVARSPDLAQLGPDGHRPNLGERPIPKRDLLTVAGKVLGFALDEILREQFEVRIAGLPGGQAPALTLEPKSLLAAMWLQLRDATAGGFAYRECVCCKAPFEVSRAGRRRQSRFCDKAKCRQQHRRDVNRLVHEMMAGGQSLDLIAQALDERPDVIQRHARARL
jgi:hypothetical protein